MADTTREQLLSNVLSVVSDLEGNKMVHGPDAGEELPDDAVQCVGMLSDPVHITGWDRKVPAEEFDADGSYDRYCQATGTPLYHYDEDEETWTCAATGQTWESEGIGWWWSDEDDLILGGEELDEVRPQIAVDWLQDALDIEYRVSPDKEYRGAEIVVTTGGPHIYVDTTREVVVGLWGTDRIERGYVDEIGLDDAMEELWECS